MQWAAQPAVYRPLDEDPPLAAAIAVRTNTKLPVAAEFQRDAASIDPGVAIGDIKTLRQAFGTYLSYPRFRALVLGGFAIFSLLLASIGLYGVLSQLVEQRTQEFGVRIAIGARPADIARLTAWQAGIPVAAGLIAGTMATLALGRYLSAMLYNVSAGDTATLASVASLLLATAGAAIVLPARRATRVDPVIALREH